MDRKTLQDLASGLMLKRVAPSFKERGWIYHHGLRTANLALELRQHVLPEDASKDDSLFAAGLFHDIGKDIEPHNESGAVLVRRILRDHCSRQERKAIGKLVRLHNQRGLTDDPFAMILQDADAIDHEGAMHVWIHFVVTTRCDESIDESLRFWHDEVKPVPCDVGHLNYEISRQVFEERRAFFDQFMTRFAVEAEGRLLPEPPDV